MDGASGVAGFTSPPRSNFEAQCGVSRRILRVLTGACRSSNPTLHRPKRDKGNRLVWEFLTPPPKKPLKHLYRGFSQTHIVQTLSNLCLAPFLSGCLLTHTEKFVVVWESGWARYSAFHCSMHGMPSTNYRQTEGAAVRVVVGASAGPGRSQPCR